VRQQRQRMTRRILSLQASVNQRGQNHPGPILNPSVADTPERMTHAPLRIVVFPETAKAWTARALEHDLTAAGRTAEAAIDALVRIASAHIAYDLRHGHAPLSAFGAAPRAYWNAFAGSSSKARPIEVTRSGSAAPLSCLVSVTTVNPALRTLAPPLSA